MCCGTGRNTTHYAFVVSLGAIIVTWLARAKYFCGDRSWLLFPRQSGLDCQMLAYVGGCQLSPNLAYLVCGLTCGWCPAAGRESAEGENYSWREIDRVSAANLSASMFRSNYLLRREPVVITGMYPTAPGNGALNIDELLNRCGDREVEPSHKKLSVLENTPSDSIFGKLLAWQIKSTYGLSIQEAINEVLKPRTVRELIDYLRNESAQPRPLQPAAFTSLVDYLFPLTIDSYFLSDLCPDLHDRFVVPGIGVEEHVPGTCSPPEVFISAARSRAYPTHLHATEHSIFHYVATGRKCFVFWKAEEWDKLYPMPMAGNTQASNSFFTLGDKLFLAEGLRRDFQAFPHTARTNAIHGCVEAGETLFFPCGWIHAFESESLTFAINYLTIDSVALQCSRELNARHVPRQKHTRPESWMHRHLPVLERTLKRVRDLPQSMSLNDVGSLMRCRFGEVRRA